MIVPLAGLGVWYAVLIWGMLAVTVLDSMCPPELMISGGCTASWHAPAVEALVLLCTGAVAAGIVILPALVAPSHRLQVACLAFALGAAFALLAASGGSLWGPFTIAALSGSAALWFVASSERRGRQGVSEERP